MTIDLSKFSNEDLLALKNKDLSKISDQGLMLLKNASDPTIPTPSADDGRQERKLNLFQKGVNTIADVLSFGASKPYKENVTSREIEQESPSKVAQASIEVPLKMTGDLGALATTSLLSGGDYLGLTKDSKFGQLDVPFSTRLKQAPTFYEPSEKGQKYFDKVNENLTALPMTATSKFTNLSKDLRPRGLTAEINEKIGVFKNKPFQEQLKEFTQNVKKNKIISESADEGYVFIPSAMDRPSTLERLKESTIGTSKASDLAQQTNQKVTNKLVRAYLGVDDDIPLDFELTERIRLLHGKIYAQIDKLPARPAKTKKIENIRNTGILDSKGNPIFVTGKAQDVVTKQYRNGNEILEDLKNTRFDAQMQWSYFKRKGDPEIRKKAILLDKKADKLDKELIDIAKYNNREDLIPKLQNARKQIAKAHLVEKSLNDVTGDVNAKVISKLAYQKRLIDPNIKKVARMYKGYPNLTAVPKVSSPSPFTVLDVGLTGFGFATQNYALAFPQLAKIMSARSLGTVKDTTNLLKRQLARPTPEYQPNIFGGTRNAQGIRGLLRFPRLTPSQQTLDASIFSLLGPRLVEDLEQQ